MTTVAFNRGGCPPLYYGILDAVSSAYPPVTGKLLTCSAPFRRSPPEYCYPALPLDLHVLSLPLAFILSQDQTLLCIYTIKILAYPDAPALLFVDGCLRFPSRLGHDPKVASIAAQAPSLPSTKIICGPFLFYKESTLSIYLVLGTCLYFPSSLFKELFFVYFADACVVLLRRSVTTIRSLTRVSVRRLGLNKISQRTVPRGA